MTNSSCGPSSGRDHQGVYPPGIAHPANLPGNGGYPSADEYQRALWHLPVLPQNDDGADGRRAGKCPISPATSATVCRNCGTTWRRTWLVVVAVATGHLDGSGFSFDEAVWSGIKAWANWSRTPRKRVIKAASDCIQQRLRYPGGTFVRDMVKMAMAISSSELCGQCTRRFAKCWSRPPMRNRAPTTCRNSRRCGHRRETYGLSGRELCLADGTRPEALIWSAYTPLTSPTA